MLVSTYHKNNPVLNKFITLCITNNTKHNIYMVDIEIKKDGHKVVQPYAPVIELNIMETVHRKGFTTQQLTERLGVTKATLQSPPSTR